MGWQYLQHLQRQRCHVVNFVITATGYIQNLQHYTVLYLDLHDLNFDLFVSADFKKLQTFLGSGCIVRLIFLPNIFRLNLNITFITVPNKNFTKKTVIPLPHQFNFPVLCYMVIYSNRRNEIGSRFPN